MMVQKLVFMNLNRLTHKRPPRRSRGQKGHAMKRTYNTYESEESARQDMKRLGKRKFTINYSAYWNCWVAWFNI